MKVEIKNGNIGEITKKHDDLIGHVFEPESSFISKIQYTYQQNNALELKISQIITVYFTNGEEIEYKPSLGTDIEEFNVQELYENFCSAVSVGKFWHKNIKGKYPYKIIRKALSK